MSAFKPKNLKNAKNAKNTNAINRIMAHYIQTSNEQFARLDTRALHFYSQVQEGLLDLRKGPAWASFKFDPKDPNVDLRIIISNDSKGEGFDVSFGHGVPENVKAVTRLAISRFE